MSGRYSSPPTRAKLVASTTALTESLDTLERRVGGEVLPAEVAIAALDLSDEQRLAAARELWALHRKLGNIHMSDTLHTFERLARERLGK